MNIKQASVFFSRLALFVIYFWFGLLKVVGQSPASEMVESLFGKTLAYVPFLSFGIFIVFFGLFEMLIGILFLVPGKERLALGLFFLHMIMVALPLFIIPSMWTVIFVPTLEGQYIIKKSGPYQLCHNNRLCYFTQRTSGSSPTKCVRIA